MLSLRNSRASADAETGHPVVSGSVAAQPFNESSEMVTVLSECTPANGCEPGLKTGHVPGGMGPVTICHLEDKMDQIMQAFNSMPDRYAELCETTLQALTAVIENLQQRLFQELEHINEVNHAKINHVHADFTHQISGTKDCLQRIRIGQKSLRELCAKTCDVAMDEDRDEETVENIPLF